ncbi:MAG: glycosyltransferase family 2 protein [Deltaproteobacteria bacterium]|nr:MAG: glycosyltransferase family 2 protein [Deltaproteobacteria bacterium]TMQ09307.1 MAG: glycosyltransferase family 2 protein [Deltaproteobacteria bacterium]
MRLCAIIPTYNNPRTLEEVVARVREHIADVVVVDDGSAEPARRVAQELAATGGCEVVFRERNGGKGAAVKTGLAWARDHHFDYALQIDADLQHDPADIPKLVARISGVGSPPEGTLVLAQPIFDASAPRGRLRARKISVFWAMIETLGRKVGDPLCGYRVYPVATALRVATRGNAMDFDPEIAVRLVWAGVAVVHVPTPVIYRSAEDGGVSHYRKVIDTLLIAGAHFRLCTEGLLRLLTSPVRALIRRLRHG